MWITLADEVAEVGGKLVIGADKQSRSPLGAFVSRWKAVKSRGFVDGWSADGGLALSRTEQALWSKAYAPLLRMLDRAGEVGAVGLPGADKRLHWHYAFGFPSLAGGPCGRILIGQPALPAVLDQLETRLGQTLPPIARIYHRVMGEMLFAGDLVHRRGVLGLAGGFLPAVGDPARAWFGKQGWVPWRKRKPLACAALNDDPDELWWCRGMKDRVLLVSHDPGEVQDHAASLAVVIAARIKLQDPERWVKPNPHGLRRQAEIAADKRKFDEAVTLYRTAEQIFRSERDSGYARWTRLDVAGTLSDAGKHAQAVDEGRACLDTFPKRLRPSDRLHLSSAFDHALGPSLLALKRGRELLKLIEPFVRGERDRELRWDLIGWQLQAWISLGDRKAFARAWRTLIGEIVTSRKRPSHPIEPDLDEIAAAARARRWGLDPPLPPEDEA
jgi:hypothetical protein